MSAKNDVQSRLRTPLVATYLAMTLVGGCTGAIVNDGQTGATEPSPGGTAGAGTGMKPPRPTTPDPQPDVPAPAPAATFGTTKLRRLTRDEYNNTVRDLFGTLLRPGSGFGADTLGESGFLVGGIVSQVEASQYLDAGERLASEAAKNVATLVPCPGGAAAEDTCAASFIESFGRRVYRRPLNAEELADLKSLYSETKTKAYPFAQRIEFILTAMLQSPNFLYRWEFGTPVDAKSGINALTSWELASRLSYFLWASMPDDALFAAAESGALLNADEVVTHARRLLASPKARDALAKFKTGWLHFIDGDVPKDTKKYKTWSTDVLAALDAETEEFVVRALSAGGNALETLFPADYTYGNDTVAKFYGLAAPQAGLGKLSFTAGSTRSGVLTHATVLARNAGPSATSPVRRGHMIRERFLCGETPPPPDNLNPVPPTEDATKQIRDQVLEHANNPDCSGCHSLMDGFGLALEGFDAVGLVRDTDAGRPINPSGRISGTDFDGEINGAKDLGQKLARSEAAQRCFTKQMFRFAMGRKETNDAQTIDAAFKAFKAASFDARELILGLVKSDAFRFRKTLEGETGK